MAFNVPTQEEFEKLLNKVSSLDTTVGELNRRLLQKEKEATQWLTKRDARNYFISNGKPVAASTFNDWVAKWLMNGTLVQNVNCKYVGDTLLIAADFLRSGTLPNSITPLKKAS